MSNFFQIYRLLELLNNTLEMHHAKNIQTISILCICSSNFQFFTTLHNSPHLHDIFYPADGVIRVILLLLHNILALLFPYLRLLFPFGTILLLPLKDQSHDQMHIRKYRYCFLHPHSLLYRDRRTGS